MQLFVRARQKFVKKQSLHGVNEHFEQIFNAAKAERCVFGQAPGRTLPVKPRDHTKIKKLFHSLEC